ncbi:MAG: lytic transglycosylase [Mycobacteriaceae bacterium]|nr:lytic transglycosylase [Mycobacteriaceae bacterium]
MRVRASMTLSVLVMAGLATAGSATAGHPATTARPDPAPAPRPDAALAARAVRATVGVVSDTTPAAQRRYRSANDLGATSDLALTSGLLGSLGGALDIPQIALAAYRNAELQLAKTNPRCGLSWSLLAGIGKIESGHAAGGNTDSRGTTVTPILGPALDGHLPGNEVLRSADGSFVRAVGPMQFLPGTWNHWAADALGDGTPDPNNVFDAALAAGHYLCAGGSDLRDPDQEMRAVLRYNHSASYAADVLRWTYAYRTGLVPTTVPTPALPTPITDRTKLPGQPAPTLVPPLPADVPPGPLPEQQPQQQLFHIPGLPPIPCGILCPAPQPADSPTPGQAPTPIVDAPVRAGQ